MKKAFWWILGILLSPILLFVILLILLYLPPVQNWAVDKVASMASESTGMEITVGHVNLSFPLDLAVDDVQVLTASSAPLARIERAVVDVQLLPLFGGKVVVNELEILNTQLDTDDMVEAAHVKGGFNRLFVASKGIDLSQETVELNGTMLENAQLDIQLNDSVPEDTTTSENHWKIHIDQATVRQSDITLHMPGDSMHISTHMGELSAREAMINLESQTYTVQSVDWIHGTLKYDVPTMLDSTATNGATPTIVAGSAIDFSHLDFTDIHVGIDSIFFHDPTLRLQLRTVALKERSGLQITDLTGPVVMENGSLRLPHFRLKTLMATLP